MSKIRMLKNLLGVEKLGKSSKTTGGIFVPVDETHNTGIIRYVGEDLTGKFFEGQKVIIGNQREAIRINGVDIMVMEEKNIFAIVEASDAEQKAEATQA